MLAINFINGLLFAFTYATMQQKEFSQARVFMADNNEVFVKSFAEYIVERKIELMQFYEEAGLLASLNLSTRLLLINGAFSNNRGFHIAVEAKRRFPKLSIVFILENDSMELQRKAISVSPICSLIMPVDFKSLETIIRKSLGGGVSG